MIMRLPGSPSKSNPLILNTAHYVENVVAVLTLVLYQNHSIERRSLQSLSSVHKYNRMSLIIVLLNRSIEMYITLCIIVRQLWEREAPST